jgi:hypothetical protein
MRAAQIDGALNGGIYNEIGETRLHGGWVCSSDITVAA